MHEWNIKRISEEKKTRISKKNKKQKKETLIAKNRS